ncbi:MAG: hypothetical protein IJK62_06040 [Bacteroidales bacterium]|nr:hypothetical protein [Bacteroidales bacterium]
MESNIEINEKDKFVLYLDIMGFKDRVNKSKIEELKQQLLLFKTKNNKLKPLLEGGKTKEKLIDMAQFSDSIVLVTRDSTEDDLNRISKAAAILMQTALETSFALRGAIAKGHMVFDTENQLFFGKALVDAYLLEEELCYYGVAFHESMEDSILSALNNKREMPIEDIAIPLKKGKSKHYHIAWHKLKANLQKGDISSKASNWLKGIRKSVSGNPRIYLDNTIDLINQKKEKQ